MGPEWPCAHISKPPEEQQRTDMSRSTYPTIRRTALIPAAPSTLPLLPLVTLVPPPSFQATLFLDKIVTTCRQSYSRPRSRLTVLPDCPPGSETPPLERTRNSRSIDGCRGLQASRQILSKTVWTLTCL